MANIKVSEMTEATTFDDGDYTMIVQANQNKKISKENILGDIEGDISTINTNISTIDTNIGDLTNLETSDTSSLVGAINSLLPVTVYQNSTGSNNGCTLSQNIDNAKYFLVTYRQEGYTQATKTDIVMAGESNHQLSFSHRNDAVLYTFLTYISISGTSLSVVSSTGIAVSANNAYGVSGTTIYVTKVVAFY